MSVQQICTIRVSSLLPSLLLAGAALACTAQGQSLPKDTVSSPAPPAEIYSYVFLDPYEGNQPAAKADDGQHQGIKMHGHWIIDVKNPDGTVAQHRDFENTITPSGQAYLPLVMAGYIVPSDFAIGLSLANTQAPCAPVGQNNGCIIVHSLTTSPATSLCPNYSCTTGLTSVAGDYTLNLVGSFTASRAGGIYEVRTFVGACPNTSSSLTTISPATCNATPGGNNTAYYNLSAATITAVPVAASQIVQVSVVIFFD